MSHNVFDINGDIINPIKNFSESKNLITYNNFLNKNIKEIFKIPKSISIRIESEIFNIGHFSILKKEKNKNVSYLLRLLDWKFVIPNNKEFQFIMIEIILLIFEIEI